MHAPETDTIEARSSARHTDPLAALRTAVSAAMKQLGAEKVGPAHVLGMHIGAPAPALLHPQRRDVDLSLRESLGAFIPPIELSSTSTDEVSVTITARRPGPPPLGRIWGDYTLPELAFQYSPRALVADIAATFDAWRGDGATFRARHLAAEIAYGEGRDETFDLYLPQNKAGLLPVWIFIHGGFWQAVDKAHQGQFAAGMLAAGYAVAIPNYTLTPHADLDTIVRQIQRMTAFVGSEARALGFDPNRIHAAGHSAGGHLAAILAALPEGRHIQSVLALSGLFDLQPLRHFPYAQPLGIDTEAAAARLSPITLTPLSHVRVGAVVGGGESAEFRRQTADFAHAWGVPARTIAGRNHFDLLDGLNGGELLDFAREIAAPG